MFTRRILRAVGHGFTKARSRLLPTRIPAGIASLAVILSFILSLGGFYLSRKPRISPHPMVRISDLNLGTVFATTSYLHRIGILNTSDVPSTVSGVHTSCGCAVVRTPSGGWHNQSLKPGQQLGVDLVIDLTRSVRANHSFSPSPFSAQITPEFQYGDARFSKRVVVSGQIVRAVLSDTSTVDFGDVLRSGSNDSPLVVKIESHPDVRSLKVRAEPDIAEIQLRKTANAASLYELELVPRRNLEARALAGNVHIDCVMESSDMKSSLVIPMYGRLLDDVEISQSSIPLGSLEVGTVAESQIRLFSVGRNESTVLGWRTDGQQIELNAAHPTSRSESVVRADFRLCARADEPGSFKHTFEFDIKTTAGRLMTLSGTVSYEAIGRQ